MSLVSNKYNSALILIIADFPNLKSNFFFSDYASMVIG